MLKEYHTSACDVQGGRLHHHVKHVLRKFLQYLPSSLWRTYFFLLFPFTIFLAFYWAKSVVLEDYTTFPVVNPDYVDLVPIDFNLYLIRKLL